MRYLQVKGAGELGRLHELRRRCFMSVATRQTQGRGAVLYVFVECLHMMHACACGAGPACEAKVKQSKVKSKGERKRIG